MSEYLATEKQNQFGVIELQRPNALNALNYNMLQEIDNKLKAWQNDDAIKAVMISGQGDRAFCAGGDIRKLYEAKGNHNNSQMSFFEVEYALNGYIHHYPKPYVALMHGVTMGGGLGVSVNGEIRIAASNLNMSMPETTIGFFPDTGASHFLSHIKVPGVGSYMGLNSARISAAMAKHIGLVDYIVDYKAFSDIKQRLIGLDLSEKEKTNIKSAVQNFTIEVDLTEEEKNIIEHCQFYDKSSVAEIVDALTTANTPLAQKMLTTLQQKSPTSVMLTHELLQRGKSMNIDQCLAMETKVVSSILHHPDLYEGIRAAIIDKDQQPTWKPATIDKVTPQAIASFF